jgi:hypothetical protein
MRVGRKWPWAKPELGHSADGGAPGVNLVQSGGASGSTTLGAGGGYGGFCCFALQP